MGGRPAAAPVAGLCATTGEPPQPPTPPRRALSATVGGGRLQCMSALFELHPAIGPIVDLFLLVGMTLRLSRLVIADTITLPLRGRLWGWADAAPTSEGRRRREFWVSGVECPFCVGFWLAAAAALSLLVALWLGGVWLGGWRFVAGVFALNWVAGHLGVRAGDVVDDDGDDDEDDDDDDDADDAMGV